MEKPMQKSYLIWIFNYVISGHILLNIPLCFITAVIYLFTFTTKNYMGYV